MIRRRFISLALTLALILAARARTYELIPHVYTLDLGPCAIDYYTPPAQPQVTLTAACPGRDMLRLWPWPPVTPWDEDHDRPQPPHRLPGRITDTGRRGPAAWEAI